jgi:serine/threonine protein kinase/formylglycine-generating enzyme required for sulfatase activity
MAVTSMSEKSASEPTPLGRFLEQYSKDLESQVSRRLDEYLALFPGDSEHIAEEYLALKRFREQVDEAPKSAMPAHISHYRIVKELGRGGQGVVYLAKDMKLGREVAIKMLRRGRLAIDELERLQREARIASRLDHPGICPIYDIGDYGGDPYVVMRYVKGTSLSQRIAQDKGTTSATTLFVDVSEADASSGSSAPAPGEQPNSRTSGPATPSGKDLHSVLRLIEQVARALHEAHEAQIVHRDVKPGNIIVTPEGQPVLVDFGVATMAQDSVVVVTRTGETPGTPQYMSPEQTSRTRVQLDRRTDVYSLGVTLYECLTLRLPFPDKTDFARQIMFAPVPDPRSLNPAVSKELKVVIETALEKDRNRRYATAAEFADDLRRVRDHEPIRARPVGFATRFVRWVQRNPVLAGAIISVLVILTTALILVIGALQAARSARDSEHLQKKQLERERSLLDPLSALARIEELNELSEKLWPAVPNNVEGEQGMKAWLDAANRLVNTREQHQKAVREIENGELTAIERQERSRALKKLLPALSDLQPRIREMERRLRSATTLEERTTGGTRVKAQWDDVARELSADPRFAGISPIKPQLGLIPLGKNAAGLFEFAVADTGNVMERRPEPGPGLKDAAAVVVLLPGGTLRFDRGPDPMSREPAESDFESAVLPPYFLGKHEISQAQWIRVMGSNPALVQQDETETKVDDRHPVELITWAQATKFCTRIGVRLPTQDEWELAARGILGAEFGDSETIKGLEGMENLADKTWARAIGRQMVGSMDWTDTYVHHAPIGALRPNGFGLHDMLGNVSEWCSDVYFRQRESSEATASRPVGIEKRRVIRGGAWSEGAREASCRLFRGYWAEGIQPSIGVRIARSIEK